MKKKNIALKKKKLHAIHLLSILHTSGGGRNAEVSLPAHFLVVKKNPTNQILHR